MLYNLTRRATRSGQVLNVVREYAYLNGDVAARERLVYRDDKLVSYELEELQVGALGRAEIRREPLNPAKGRILFDYKKAAGSPAKPKTDSEALQPDTLVNDMLPAFLDSHWDALVTGAEARCRYIVVPRLETVGFTLKKQSESTWHGRSVIVFRMEATSPIIAALIEPLWFTVEKQAPHRVLQYVGRTTPKIKVGNKWQDLDAVTVFDWK